VGDRVAAFTLARQGVTVSGFKRLEGGELLPFGVDELIYRSEQIVVAAESTTNGKRSRTPRRWSLKAQLRIGVARRHSA